MNVREVPPRQLHLVSKVLSSERSETLPSELESSLDELDVGSLPESIIDDGLVLVDGDGTCRVDDVSTGCGVGVDGVDGAEEELLLEVGEEVEVSFGLRERGGRRGQLGFDAPSFEGETSKVREKEKDEEATHLVDLNSRILGDDSSSTTRRVQQHSIETSHDLGELPSVVVANDDVLASESVNVSRQRLGSSLVGVIGEDETGVLKESGDVGGLSSGSGSHVEDSLVGLRRESDDGEEGGSRLEHVVTSEVLGSGT